MTGRFARPRATIHAVTRPLTARERDILNLFLSIDLPGAGELREQAMSVSAEREGMVIDLIVNEGPPSATVVSRTPVQLPSAATATTVAYCSCGRRSAGRPGVTHLVSSLGMMGPRVLNSILVFPAAPLRRVYAI
jgi:hypothetical protein